MDPTMSTRHITIYDLTSTKFTYNAYSININSDLAPLLNHSLLISSLFSPASHIIANLSNILLYTLLNSTDEMMIKEHISLHIINIDSITLL